MSHSVRDRVIAIVAEQAMLDPGQITLGSTRTDLGIDSVALVEAVLAIEEAFGISIPFNANEPEQSDFDISSVGAIIAAVVRLVAEKA